MDDNYRRLNILLKIYLSYIKFKLKLNLKVDDQRVNKYLRGETFDSNLNDGFGTIILEGCALGGFKMSKGKFKNFYPKGLRNF